MATVIDSLVVALSLDSKEFQRGSKAATADFNRTKSTAQRVGKDIERSGKQGAEFFVQLRKAALQFFTVLTVGRGLADFTRQVITSGAQLDRMASRVGASASSLSKWQGAVRQSGGSADGFLATIQNLSNQLTQLQLTGEAPIRDLMQRLGVSAADASGKAKPILEILRDIGDALDSKGWASADKFNLLMSAGLDEGTINLLMRGRVEREKLIAAQKEYSEADAKAAREAEESWEKAKLDLERMTQTLVIKALPAIKQLVESMLKLAEVAIPMLAGLVSGFVSLNDATNGWLLTLGLVLVSLRAMKGLLGGLAAGGGAAAAGGAAAGGAAAGAAAGVAKVLKGSAGLAALLYSGGLNAGEEEELARRRAMGPTIDGPPQNSGLSRAERNNNPGNLNFAGQRGASLESGPGARFARFNSTAEGVAALVNQLQRYGSRGLDTIEKIISVYAPSSENDASSYINRLSQTMGVSASSKLDLSNPNVLAGLVRGISTHEAGRNFLSDRDVMSGLQMSGFAGARGATNISVGEVKVFTQATDAAGIARDLQGAIVRQADTGMR